MVDLSHVRSAKFENYHSVVFAYYKHVKILSKHELLSIVSVTIKPVHQTRGTKSKLTITPLPLPRKYNYSSISLLGSNECIFLYKVTLNFELAQMNKAQRQDILIGYKQSLCIKF